MLISLLNPFLNLYTGSIESKTRFGGTRMNRLMTIIMIPAAVTVSLLISCSPTITHLPPPTTLKPQAAAPISQFVLPTNTNSFALVMFTFPNPGESHCYWVLYNIPASVTHLEKNVTGIGTLGNNSVNKKLEYAPPCSKGPGPKLYAFSIFALSASPQFAVPPTRVSKDVLLSSIKDITLASAELNVYYSREKWFILEVNL
jgi:phosphatidylethanolamine-binding protein (PEBP) family uncharacterized protein